MRTVIAALGRRVALWLTVWLCSSSALASAGSARRVVLVAAPPTFADALRVALSPWGITVDEIDAALPPAESGPAAGAATRIARERDAALVIWVQVAADGATWLWIYDVATGQLAQRPLPAGAPTTAEPAAAAALTAKAMIRLSVVAPPSERFGATPPPSVHLLASAELRPISAGPTDVRILTQSIGASAVVAGQLTIDGQLSAGPGFAVDDPRLIARFTRTSLSAGVGYRVAAGSWWRLEPAAALGVHFTSLDGAIPGGATPVATSRTNLSVGAQGRFFLRLGEGLELAVHVGLDVPLSRQRYLLAGSPILELPAVEPLFGFQLRVPID